MFLQRALFKGDILTEFGIPEGGTDKVAIIACGAPTYPGKPGQHKTAAFLMKQGYAAFIPRYRGSWESRGEFLVKPLQDDVLDVLDGIEGGFSDIFDQNTYKIDIKEVIIIGGSFGGPAAFYAALDPRVSRVMAVSPVVDWQAKSIDEPFEIFCPLMKKGFGGAYRISDETWEKLEAGEIYNPVTHVTQFKDVADKIWIIHAEDDNSVLYGPVKKFADEVGCKLTTLKKGGHLGTAKVMRNWSLRRKFKKYLRL